MEKSGNVQRLYVVECEKSLKADDPDANSVLTASIGAILQENSSPLQGGHTEPQASEYMNGNASKYDTSEGDRQLLAEVFNAIGGPSWVCRDNWLGLLHVSHWHGVTVDELGRVTGIILEDNHTTGSSDTRCICFSFALFFLVR